jgi:hypothetical protein
MMMVMMAPPAMVPAPMVTAVVTAMMTTVVASMMSPVMTTMAMSAIRLDRRRKQGSTSKQRSDCE